MDFCALREAESLAQTRDSEHRQFTKSGKTGIPSERQIGKNQTTDNERDNQTEWSKSWTRLKKTTFQIEYTVVLPQPKLSPISVYEKSNERSKPGFANWPQWWQNWRKQRMAVAHKYVSAKDLSAVGSTSSDLKDSKRYFLDFDSFFHQTWHQHSVLHLSRYIAWNLEA